MISRSLRHVVLALIVFIWVVPFVALLTTSFRSETATKTSGFWTAFTPTLLGHRFSTSDGGEDAFVTYQGNIFDRLNKDDPAFPVSGTVASVFFKGRVPDPDNEGETILLRRLVTPGEVMDVRDGQFVFDAQGDFTWTFPEATAPKPKNLDVFINQNPSFGAEAYVEVMWKNKHVPNALISSFIVTIPATIIPITIAAFAAYAFAWLRFPGRDILFVVVVALLVVPLQLAFLPVLEGFTAASSWSAALNAWVTGCQEDCEIFPSKSFATLWISHTAFGLPLAIYLLRNYIVGLPRELLESARIDGANHLQVFVRLIVPLSVPALASFAIFQFLWVWNDLLVALYLGPNQDSDLVFPIRLQKQLGTFKDELHLLNASAVISMIVPVAVFLSMQRYFIRGLLAGSVKGG